MKKDLSLVNKTFRSIQKIIPFILAIAFIFIVWQIGAMISNNATLLPGPTVVMKTFLEFIVSGEAIEHTVASLLRIVLAWVLSAFIAIPIGVIMGRIALLEKLLHPVIELIRPISPLAWIPLAVLWFGIGLSGKVFVIVIASLFPILLNTISGIKGVNPILLKAGQSFGFSQLRITTRICLPAAMPTIVTGLRISFGSAWMAIIAAEMVASRSGLGYMINDGMEILRPDIVIMGMVIIGVVGFCLMRYSGI